MNQSADNHFKYSTIPLNTQHKYVSHQCHKTIPEKLIGNYMYFKYFITRNIQTPTQTLKGVEQNKTNASEHYSFNRKISALDYQITTSAPRRLINNINRIIIVITRIIKFGRYTLWEQRQFSPPYSYK